VMVPGLATILSAPQATSNPPDAAIEPIDATVNQ